MGRNGKHKENGVKWSSGVGVTTGKVGRAPLLPGRAACKASNPGWLRQQAQGNVCLF